MQTELEASDPFELQLQGIVCATADGADRPLDRSITDILRLVRDDFGMDDVFVAKLVDDLNIVTLADSVSKEMDIEGFSYPKAESFCQRVLDGACPQSCLTWTCCAVPITCLRRWCPSKAIWLCWFA